jgi:hypothetical protein
MELRAAALMFSALLHVVFCVVLLFLNKHNLTLTVRRQFDDWSPLIDLYRQSNKTAESFAEIAPIGLELSWCAAPLPRGTLRAPYCSCLQTQQRIFASSANASSIAVSGSLVGEGKVIPGLVSCLSARPVWRVWPAWKIQLGTPAVYLLFVSAVFLWMAADLGIVWTSIPMWTLSVLVCVALVAGEPIANAFWGLTVIFVAAFVQWILLPGMVPLRRDDYNPVTGSDFLVERTRACFWWCEYMCAPVFAVYVSLMHCGRDALFMFIMFLLGFVLGGMGLRSFWYEQSPQKDASVNNPTKQFIGTIHWVTWLVIVVSGVTLLAIASIYFQPTPEYTLGVGSVTLLALTFFICILQWPGCSSMEWVFPMQYGNVFVRNVLLFSLVAYDMR